MSTIPVGVLRKSVIDFIPQVSIPSGYPAMEHIPPALDSLSATADDKDMRKFFRRCVQVLAPILTAVGGLTDILPSPVAKAVSVIAGTLASLFVSPPGKSRD